MEIDGKEYEILDAKESITIPDCFVKDANKIGKGHGEAKLYVGQTTDQFTLDFFGDFKNRCVIKKSDLLSYMQDCENEYKHPDQEYRNKKVMPEIYAKHIKKINSMTEEFIYFDIYRVDVLTNKNIY